MLKSRYSIVLFLFSLFFLNSCDSYNKLLKSDNVELKKEKAKEYYNKGNYYKALPLLEELLSVYRGTEELEYLYYIYCYCYYGQESYIVSAYNFKNFVSSFPESDKAEECLFMHAYSYYQVSPDPELDQTYTYKAIDAFQLFINAYPESARLNEANVLIEKLNRKLEMKAFLAAKLYYDMGTYKAAVTAFQNILEEYPESPQAETSYWLMLKSSYLLAKNSIESKQKNRYRDTLKIYKEFKKRFPNSKHLNDAESMYAASMKIIQ